MKNIAFFIFTLAAITLAACSETIQPEEHATVQLVAGFVPVHADADGTKAVKTSWEDGDVVFIFFQDVTADSRYLEMRYENGSWTQTFKNGLAATDLTPDGSKTLTAVYLPFCNDAVPSYTHDGNMGLWHFSKTSLSYYMYADRVLYTVHTSNGIATITVAENTLKMSFPNFFVQFFFEDAAAADGGASLMATGLRPRGLGSVGKDGMLYESGPASVGSAMPGYAYKGGYLFSGVLDPALGGVKTNYDFKLLQDASARTAKASGKTLQVYGTTGRAVNITRLGWSGSDSFGVPMYELDGKIRYFAKMNVGSASETDAGDYVAWGESEGWKPGNNGKFATSFDWNNYKWGYDAGENGIKVDKYCTQERWWGGTGAMDNKAELDPEDDAVTAYLGGSWRTPTDAEWRALITECNWTWNNSGVKGYHVTGRGTFSTSRIFLPAAGYGYGEKIDNDSKNNGYYWSSSLHSATPDFARSLYFSNKDGQKIFNYDRCKGYLVRPVMSK